MSLEDSNTSSKSPAGDHFTFAVIVFSLVFIVPLAIFAIIGFNHYSEHEMKMKCLELNKTYVNSLCLEISPVRHKQIP